MPTDMVTCTNCGKTFSVGVPRGKRIKNYDDAGFWTRRFLLQARLLINIF
jgi:hypothetical protein